MKPFHLLLATGNTIPEAVKLLNDQLNAEYANQACQLQQIFLMPQAVPVTAITTTPNGQPQVKFVINLVALISEEPEVDSLQRNFKPVFDFVNNNRDDLMPIIIGYLATIVGAIPPELQAKFDSLKNKS